MVRTRPTLPAGHGEVVERPDFAQWADLARQNRTAAATWEFDLAGVPIAEARAQARAELIAAAEVFSARMGVEVRPAGDADELLIVTGHQPELYHTGVWVKDFLVERFARETGATAIDLVVDSDGYDVLGVSAPCMSPGVARCRQYLSIGAADSCFAFSAVPSAKALDEFCSAADSMLASLPAPAVRRHFSAFCEHMRAVAPLANNVAELITFARRRFEASVGTGYLESPVTALARTRAFAGFVAHIALDAPAFSHAYNQELAAYRALTKTRSAAQPFPDLIQGPEGIELPLWRLHARRRDAVFARATDDGVELLSGGEVFAALPAEPSRAVDAVLALPDIVAPKALSLTMFTRLLACDLFVHGIGGGRYDQVTDGVIRRYFGVEPPHFTVASMTMYLPLGAHVVSDEEVAAAKERLNRLDHNPDALLAEVEFDTAQERDRALELAGRKSELVRKIGAPDADKKALGLEIREVNAELAAIMAPLKAQFEAEVATLEMQRQASEILTDRTYPFCFWDPAEIADKVW